MLLYNKKYLSVSRRSISLILSFFLFFFGFCGNIIDAQATDLEEMQEEAQIRKALPIQSNEIDNWPVGPQVSSQAAILMDVNTGVILY